MTLKVALNLGHELNTANITLKTLVSTNTLDINYTTSKILHIGNSGSASVELKSTALDTNKNKKISSCKPESLKFFNSQDKDDPGNSPILLVDEQGDNYPIKLVGLDASLLPEAS